MMRENVFDAKRLRGLTHNSKHAFAGFDSGVPRLVDESFRTNRRRVRGD